VPARSFVTILGVDDRKQPPRAPSTEELLAEARRLSTLAKAEAATRAARKLQREKRESKKTS
jgi:hypothetical protein